MTKEELQDVYVLLEKQYRLAFVAGYNAAINNSIGEKIYNPGNGQVSFRTMKFGKILLTKACYLQVCRDKTMHIKEKRYLKN